MIHPEEKKRQLANWAVWHCPWDKVYKTNKPTTIVSPLFKTREEAEMFMEKQYPHRKEYEYGVFRTDGLKGYY